MENIKVMAFSAPEEVLKEIDRVALDWQIGRSGAIRRIFQEWKATRPNASTQPAQVQPAPTAQQQ